MPVHSEDAPDPQTWLQRQWQRVRALWARDIILGQVGEGATNVIIGKNNVQVNVGGRNLTLPIWLIALLLLALVLLWVYPLLWPYWNPTRMKSTLNIAVTEFGERDAGWFDRRPEVTTFLSTWLGQKISDPTNWGDDQPNIQVWQNELPTVATAIKPPLPRVTTADEARQVAERRNANLVIYGTLNRTADPATLTLGFYYKPAPVPNQPSVRAELVDVFAGPQQIGKPITLDYIDSDLYTYEIDKAEHPLRVRALALIWLAHGLAKDLTGNPAAALQIFQQAKTALPAWQDEDGKWLLYFLEGREAFILHDLSTAEAAFTQAIEASNQQYLNAYFGRGNVYYDRAQRGLLGQMPSIAPATNDLACTEPLTPGAADVDPTLLPQSTDAIIIDADRALADYQIVAQGGENPSAATTSEAQLLRHIAQWMIGNSYRLKADAYLYDQQFDQAAPALGAAETALTSALDTFTADDNLVEFAIHTRYHLGLVQRAQGYRAESNGDWQTSRQWYRQAQTAFTECAAQAEAQWPKHPRFFARSAACSCQAFATEVEQTLHTLEEQQGGDG